MRTAMPLTRSARTPSRRAVEASSAAARMCRPSDVRERSRRRSARQTAAVTIATIVILRMSTLPIVMGRLSATSDVAVLPSGPNQRSAMDCSRKDTAKVATSITAADCARSGRKTARSMANESTRTTAKQRRIPTHTGQPRPDAYAIANAPAMISCP